MKGDAEIMAFWHKSVGDFMDASSRLLRAIPEPSDGTQESRTPTSVGIVSNSLASNPLVSTQNVPSKMAITGFSLIFER
jgi:hypothetical protein